MPSTDNRERSSAFRILDLPPELLDGIARFLSKDHLPSFRHTCKHIHKHTSTAFSSCCFHTIRTDLGFESVRKLEKIARNEGFAPHVCSLLIKGRRHNHFGKGIKWERDSQGHLLLEQPAVDRFRDILRSFPKCASFYFEKLPESGESVSEPLALGETVNMILATLVSIKRPLKEFEIRPVSSLGSHPNAGGIDLDALTIAKFKTPEFMDLYSSLQALTIGYQAGAGAHVATEFGLHLIQSASQLRRLSLHGQYTVGGMDIINRMLTAKLDFQLEDLSLAMASGVNGEDLRSFLTLHCQDLKSLKFQFLGLEYEGWIPTINHLTTGFTKLRHIELDHLSDSWKKETFLVEFTDVIRNTTVDKASRETIQYRQYRRAMGGDPRIFTVSYDGPRMDIALQKIAAAATIRSSRYD